MDSISGQEELNQEALHTPDLKKWPLGERIGQGAFGDAFLVQDPKTRKKFVLKRVRMARQNEWQRVATKQEIKLGCMLQHPFIVRFVKSWIRDGHEVNIVYGYCEQGDLQTMMRKQKGKHIEEVQLRRWLAELLLALHYMQGKHVLHRDLKSSNIFVTADNDVQIGDFGLATIRDMEDSSNHDQSIVGTPHFMSPELLNRKSYDYKTDVWSLGCVIYELAALRPAFNAFNLNGLVSKICKSAVAPLPSLYSEDMSSLIKWMLRKSAAKRPSVEELLSCSSLREEVAWACQRAKQLSPDTQLPNLLSSEQLHKVPGSPFGGAHEDDTGGGDMDNMHTPRPAGRAAGSQQTDEGEVDAQAGEGAGDVEGALLQPGSKLSPPSPEGLNGQELLRYSAAAEPEQGTTEKGGEPSSSGMAGGMEGEAAARVSEAGEAVEPGSAQAPVVEAARTGGGVQRSASVSASHPHNELRGGSPRARRNSANVGAARGPRTAPLPEAGTVPGRNPSSRKLAVTEREAGHPVAGHHGRLQSKARRPSLAAYTAAEGEAAAAAEDMSSTSDPEHAVHMHKQGGDSGAGGSSKRQAGQGQPWGTGHHHTVARLSSAVQKHHTGKEVPQYRDAAKAAAAAVPGSEPAAAQLEPNSSAASGAGSVAAHLAPGPRAGAGRGPASARHSEYYSPRPSPVRVGPAASPRRPAHTGPALGRLPVANAGHPAHASAKVVQGSSSGSEPRPRSSSLPVRQDEAAPQHQDQDRATAPQSASASATAAVDAAARQLASASPIPGVRAADTALIVSPSVHDRHQSEPGALQQQPSDLVPRSSSCMMLSSPEAIETSLVKRRSSSLCSSPTSCASEHNAPASGWGGRQCLFDNELFRSFSRSDSISASPATAAFQVGAEGLHAFLGRAEKEVGLATLAPGSNVALVPLAAAVSQQSSPSLGQLPLGYAGGSSSAKQQQAAYASSPLSFGGFAGGSLGALARRHADQAEEVTPALLVPGSPVLSDPMSVSVASASPYEASGIKRTLDLTPVATSSSSMSVVPGTARGRGSSAAVPQDNIARGSSGSAADAGPAPGSRPVPPPPGSEKERLLTLERAMALASKLYAARRWHELGTVLESVQLPASSSPASGVQGPNTRAVPEAASGTFRLGDKVIVGSRRGMGTIRYYGPCHWAEGEYVGLELERPEGKYDGTIDGIGYFHCLPLHGIFVRASMLKPGHKQ